MINQTLETFQLFKADIFKALIETLDMMSFAMIVTLILGVIFGYVLFVSRADGIHENKILYFIVSNSLNVIRSIPFILFIIVMIPINRMIINTGFGVNASKLPLSLIGIATFSRFTEQDFLDVDKSMFETSYALGANSFQYFKQFLLKEAQSSLVLSFVSTTISLLSYSTVMGIIGGGGLGYLAMSEGYYNFNYELMWIIIVIMIVLVQIVQTTGNLIAKKYDKR